MAVKGDDHTKRCNGDDSAEGGSLQKLGRWRGKGRGRGSGAWAEKRENTTAQSSNVCVSSGASHVMASLRCFWYPSGGAVWLPTPVVTLSGRQTRRKTCTRFFYMPLARLPYPLISHLPCPHFVVSALSPNTDTRPPLPPFTSRSVPLRCIRVKCDRQGDAAQLSLSVDWYHCDQL